VLQVSHHEGFLWGEASPPAGREASEENTEAIPLRWGEFDLGGGIGGRGQTILPDPLENESLGSNRG